MGQLCARQSCYHWDDAAGEWIWWWNHEVWIFTEHYTSCDCCHLRDVWVSPSDCIYIDGPNPWKAWLQDEQYYVETSMSHNKNFAKVALMSRLNTEVVLLVLQF